MTQQAVEKTKELKDRVSKAILHEWDCPMVDFTGACNCPQEESVQAILSIIDEEKGEAYKKGVKDLAHEIDCNTLISELSGWKSIIEYSVERILKALVTNHLEEK